MILHPGILSLIIASALTSLLVLSSAGIGAGIFRRWDLASGSSLQLSLERRTYLVSAVLGYALLYQLLSLFLFVHTADRLCSLFTGAMCAAGTLNLNRWGYPVLLLKMANFLLAGIWLVLNHADNRAPDYPLTRVKYALLLGLAPLVAGEGVLQFLHFRGLSPDVITSCCASLFGSAASGVSSDLAALPPRPMMLTAFPLLGLTAGLGVAVRLSGRGACLLAAFSGAGFLAAVSSVLSFIAPYVYELPSHHCPFCLLQGEYGYIGYPLYAALLGGTVAGLGAGVLQPFRRIPTLASVVPAVQRNLGTFTALGFGLFTLLAAFIVLRSGLIL